MLAPTSAVAGPRRLPLADPTLLPFSLRRKADTREIFSVAGGKGSFEKLPDPGSGISHPFECRARATFRASALEAVARAEPAQAFNLCRDNVRAQVMYQIVNEDCICVQENKLLKARFS
jgi:hypothetical protein